MNKILNENGKKLTISSLKKILTKSITIPNEQELYSETGYRLQDIVNIALRQLVYAEYEQRIDDNSIGMKYVFHINGRVIDTITTINNLDGVRIKILFNNGFIFEYNDVKSVNNDMKNVNNLFDPATNKIDGKYKTHLILKSMLASTIDPYIERSFVDNTGFGLDYIVDNILKSLPNSEFRKSELYGEGDKYDYNINNGFIDAMVVIVNTTGYKAGGLRIYFHNNYTIEYNYGPYHSGFEFGFKN